MVDEKTDITQKQSFVPYADLLKAGIAKLDACIKTIDGAAAFNTPSSWFGGSAYSSAELKALANSFKARAIVYGSRTKAENDAVNWSDVLSLANAGIERNLAPQGTGVNTGTIWVDWKRFLTLAGWARVDLRIISMLVNKSASYPTNEKGFGGKYPARYNIDDKPLPASNGEIKGNDSTNADARLHSDFVYTNIPHRAERGRYHFSNYRLSKFDPPPRGNDRANSNSTLDDLTVYENKLFIAEAKARTGDLAGAIAILNNADNARKKRGKLDDLPASSSLQVVLDAIFYERDIELIGTGMGLAFFDMRRRDLLQPGTLLHFPVPANELQVLEKELYTLGGSQDGASKGKWFEPKTLR